MLQFCLAISVYINVLQKFSNMSYEDYAIVI